MIMLIFMISQCDGLVEVQNWEEIFEREVTHKATETVR